MLPARFRDHPPWGLLARHLVERGNPAPILLARRLRGISRPPVSLLSIYRGRNGSRLRAVLAGLPEADFTLWALDEPVPALRGWTIGSGPGTRTELLNRLWQAARPKLDSDALLIVIDDDVAISARQLDLHLRACRAARLDLAQPAHRARSYTSWPFVRQRFDTYVRLTRFVEQGPLITLSRGGAEVLFPLPEELGMGWGLEALWSREAAHGLRLGIVDAASMRHLAPVSQGYDREAQEAQRLAVLSEAGMSSYSELQVDDATWRIGAPTPDWVIA